MAKAVAIVPVGHDFPPFSANKGGAVEGSKIYLLTYDLAFQIQEQLRALDGGAPLPPEIGRDAAARGQYVAAVAAPAAAMGDSAGAPVQPPAVARPGRDVRGPVRRLAVQPRRPRRRRARPAGAAADDRLPGDQPHAGRLRAAPDRRAPGVAAHRRPASRCASRAAPGCRSAMVRWFRNTFKGSGLEFGCELLSDAPEAAAAVAEDAPASSLAPVVVLPEEHAPGGAEQRAAADHRCRPASSQLEQAVSLRRGEQLGLRRADQAGRAGSRLRALRVRRRCRDLGTGPALPSGRAPPAAPAGCGWRSSPPPRSSCSSCCGNSLLAPLRPGGSWLALKALPLALLLPGVARGALRPRQVARLRAAAAVSPKGSSAR